MNATNLTGLSRGEIHYIVKENSSCERAVMSRAKNWCFTLNNYTHEDVARILGLEAEVSVSYCVFGREIGESGTPHLQGFVSFKERKTRASVVALLGQAHFTVARRVQNSIEYCKKDGDFSEFGTPPVVSQGQRSDIELFKEEVASGVLDPKLLRETHSEVWAKYPRFCQEYLLDHQPVVAIESHQLRDWQEQLWTELLEVPDRRKVVFLVDIQGNSGKTWFAHHFVRSNVRPSQVLLPGKKADMAFALENTTEVLFVDAPRSKQGDYLQYDFLEEVKNGYVFSSKYESRLKCLKPCHVVVSMNEEPDLTKLSFDRYDIRRLTDIILND